MFKSSLIFALAICAFSVADDTSEVRQLKHYRGNVRKETLKAIEAVEQIDPEKPAENRALLEQASEYAAKLSKLVYYMQQNAILHHETYDDRTRSLLAPILNSLSISANLLQQAASENHHDLQAKFKIDLENVEKQVLTLIEIAIIAQATQSEHSDFTQDILELMFYYSSTTAAVYTSLQSRNKSPQVLYKQIQEITKHASDTLDNINEPDKLDYLGEYCMFLSMELNEFISWTAYWYKLGKSQEIEDTMQKFFVGLNDFSTLFQTVAVGFNTKAISPDNMVENVAQGLKQGADRVKVLSEIKGGESGAHFARKALVTFLIAVQDFQRELETAIKKD